MKTIVSEILKHIRVLRLFTRNYIQKQMEYRCSFFVYLAVESIVLVSKLLYVGVTYNMGITVNGLEPVDILIFNGTFFIISGIYAGFFMMNFSDFRNKVKSGDLDMLIIKPVSLQFMSTMSTIEYAVLIPNVLTGIVIVCQAWRLKGMEASPYNILGYIGLLVCGVVISYNLLFLPQLLAFKLIEVSSLATVTSSLSNFNMMPMHIYPSIMQRIGIFIFPIFVVSNFPAMVLLGKLNPYFIVWAVFAAIALTVIVRFIWKLSIKNYSSSTS